MFNQAKMFQLLTPAKFVAIDIETGNAPAEAVENAVDNWKAPKNWKPETVENKRAEMAEKKRDKAALLDASPILCIACRTDNASTIFHSMGETDLKINWTVSDHENEQEMLIKFRTWADSTITTDTVIAGHNLIVIRFAKNP